MSSPFILSPERTAEAAKLGLPPPDFSPDDTSSGKIVNTVSADGLSL